ncbi:phosphopantothenoylcysteine decarboxylase/phosphopantothenate--cysteine ligase [Caldicellulosiruptor bescii]|uniref:Coenzyme A biosynthesis bifunctional protein CoaBC n=2 Tax=Caldicellulosiruptor bescii TaxID=31899 RepID=B9MR34_CALBD|nr:bifunctional phosphopantothenoylcysteine decarboxylase/phosphopantothenate--cysteine ligase CoaBC [Caldicellulosiruptor bescii]ACM60138.1 phosphopantothenoylcysteine decarboxylase/phosphopantothenate/cysteine ligase [Caldicellulosiruptor bescii DSM 6725]PBC87553.1 phosphopantothenoylcysteine decarboxylase/phosphopantothenate--cysteine ligase [Caldicellulosiruptor bescii]PBC90486.1 phosphopantothenoylcysteine decarboxylase/phosphopantothenate--cysteine ligase [Caldicellulosiruptor bescii]PBD0
MRLKNKNVLIGICGGIAAYKVCELIRLLKKNEANVKVIMTKNAQKFITPLTLQTLSQNKVYTDTFESEYFYDIEHISLTTWADILVVAPATANIIGKFANGIADDLLTTTFLAFDKPVLIVPAMNSNMFENAIVKQNIHKLKSIGINFVEPESGFLACGVYGKGRYPENQKILIEIEKLLCSQDLAGKKVLITAGPTREYLDPIRFISNRSSGKMGYALAEEAYKRGAQVTVVSGPVSINTYADIEIIHVQTASQMYQKVKEIYEQYDILIFSAAVADYRPKTTSQNKIKKENKDELTIELVKNPDILKFVGENKKPNQVIVGFSAETENVLENSQKKLEAKNADLIVANNVLEEGAGFDVDTNIVTLISKEKVENLPKMSKSEVAKRIFDHVVTYLCKM